jgi:hypothetical protein
MMRQHLMHQSVINKHSGSQSKYQLAFQRFEATRIIQEVAMPHYKEMLQVGI